MNVEEEELEQASGTAQVDEEKNECSEEQLNKFSQQAERDASFELTTKDPEENEKDDKHSEEWLNIYSHGAERTATWEVAEEEKEVVSLRLAAKGAKEQAGTFITPWEMELEMLEDWLNNPEPARELTECEL
jgi:hypothetical protein